MSQSPPIVLSFAAADPSGGAGIQADILTLSSMGCHALSVVTAITVQDTVGVEGVLPLDAEWVADQARCVLEDMPVTVFKLGVLGQRRDHSLRLQSRVGLSGGSARARSGRELGSRRRAATEDMVIAMRELIIPQTTLITRTVSKRVVSRSTNPMTQTIRVSKSARAASWASDANTF
jgi:hydroxymethylpyrimidine/phosphomethylpyrimidine kinase